MKKIFSIILFAIVASGLFSNIAFAGSAVIFAEEEEDVELATEAAPPSVTAPTIPKPSYLPGPNETTKGSEAQDYFLNVSIPKSLTPALDYWYRRIHRTRYWRYKHANCIWSRR